jgi:uncharacterized SAM-binding protein YcdF (DUF218 family)
MLYTLPPLGPQLLMPTNVLVFLVVAGFVLTRFSRTARSGHRLLVAATLTLSLVCIFPVGEWLLRPIEKRFPPFKPDGRPVSGIIVLGGSVTDAPMPRAFRSQPNEASDRIFEAASLARAYPGASVVVSGGPIQVDGRSEADAVAGFLVTLGVQPSRLTLERRSRDTSENARFTRAIAHPATGERWLLVTSAFHMPRAVGAFRAVGFPVTAAPADWRTGWHPYLNFSYSYSLKMLDLAAKEYLGLLAYRLRGRTHQLFPGPESAS